MHHLRAAFGLLILASCGGSQVKEQITILPPPEPMTKGALAGPLCKTDACTCRDPSLPADGGAGVPDAGKKRFEVHVGPIEHSLWVTIDDTVLYKGEARAEECFYVDLAPGDHRVRIIAHQPEGISAQVAISEYAAATQSWYATYDFACGAPGVCAADDMDEYKQSLTKYPRGIHDPCGSVKLKGMSWDTGVAPDQVHPEDLTVGFTMEIYEFAPKAPHGDPSCADHF